MWRVGGFLYYFPLYIHAIIAYKLAKNEIEIKCLRLNIYLDKGYYLPNDRLVI